MSSSAGADDAWQVWYEDTFDRECPRQVEASGRGLVNGLIELWVRHLFETVRPDGGAGFSRFNLWCDGRSVTIVGERAGAARLRGWIWRRGDRAGDDYRRIADHRLLREVAAAHASLLEAGRDSAPILALAVAAQDRRAFEAQLHDQALE